MPVSGLVVLAMPISDKDFLLPPDNTLAIADSIAPGVLKGSYPEGIAVKPAVGIDLSTACPPLK